MQAKEMRASLYQFAAMLDTAGCNSASIELCALADAIGLAKTKTVAATVKHVKEQRKLKETSEGFPRLLKALLEAALGVLEASKAAKGVLADYRSILTLCVGNDAGDTTEFYADLSDAITNPKAKPKKAPKKPVAPDPIEMRRIADRLTGLLHDNAGFDAAVAELNAPRKYSNKELAAIAERFLGYEGGHKSKASIIKAIKSRQLQEAIGASKDRRIEKISV